MIPHFSCQATLLNLKQLKFRHFLHVILQVVVADLDHNLIITSEEIPPIPEPEFSSLRSEIMTLLCPNVVGIDLMKARLADSSEQYFRGGYRPWGQDHDLRLR